ncbi:hypothetical protein AMATHDRAFT_70994, partial [Amanita thiersii Skay4041]
MFNRKITPFHQALANSNTSLVLLELQEIFLLLLQASSTFYHRASPMQYLETYTDMSLQQLV